MMKPAAAPTGVPEVIVVGEALIDVVHTGDGVTEHRGGSPANVAYGLARLGVSTGFLTSIGTDGRGLAISSHLTDPGVHMLPGSEGLAPPVLEQIARMASMAAAITVGRPGADLPSAAEVRASLVS